MTDVAMSSTPVAHPAAKLFPMLDDEALSDLVADIKRKGLLHPIVVMPDGRLLDGRNRLKACELAGVKPRFVPYRGQDPEGHVISLNLQRRHLDASQRAIIIGLRREAYWAERASEQEAARKRGDFDRNGKVEPIHAAQRAAEEAQVSEGYIKMAKRLTTEAPELAAEVLAGRVTINKADSQLTRQKTQEEARRRQRRSQVTVPRITHIEGLELLASLKGTAALILTDPPYSTDVPDIAAFAHSWMPLARAALKPSGRFYAFVGSYPEELLAYLTELASWGWEHQLLTWHFPDALRETSHRYNSSSQSILHAWGPDAPPLNPCDLTDRTTVWTFNTNSGHVGGKEHTWQKPDALAERAVRHATKPGELVADPFSGTGTFLLAAASQGREAVGAESDPAMRAIAVSRGVQVEVP